MLDKPTRLAKNFVMTADDYDGATLKLSQTSITINAGSTWLLVALILQGDSAREVFNTNEVVWTTSSKSIAIVSNRGLVTGVAAGKATIKAAIKKRPDIKAACIVTVKGKDPSSPILVKEIKISPSKIDPLYIGESIKVTATVSPTNATYASNIIWRVAAGGDAYAVEYRGTTSHVKAIRAGYSRLIAEALNTDAERQTDGNKIVGTWIPVYSYERTSPDPTPSPQPEPEPVLHVYSMTLSKEHIDAKVGDSQTLVATITDNGESHTALQNEVVWRTTNKKVAVVGSDGKVTAIGFGECTIRVSLRNDTSVFATCRVLVEKSDDSEGGDSGEDVKPSTVIRNCLSFILGKVKSIFSMTAGKWNSKLSGMIARIGGDLSMLVEKVSSGLSLLLSRKSGSMSITTKRCGNRLHCSIGLVCGVSLGVPFGTEILWVSDGMLLTIDGGNFYVEKE